MEVYTSEMVLFVGSILIFLSIFISKWGYRFGVPTLLVFLLLGMLFGRDGLGLEFDNVEDAQFIGMMAMSIILFTGGMDTKMSAIRPVMGQGILLSTVGVVITTAVTGLFIFGLGKMGFRDMQFPLAAAFLFAATMSSTDSASVFSLMRANRMHLKYNLKPLLELESGSNDPMAFMLTIVLIQIIGGAETTPLDILNSLLIQFALGGFIGYAMGKASGWVINRINLNNKALYPIMVVMFVFFTFTIADMAKGNGYLAVYICGVIVGNSDLGKFRKGIITFLDGLTWFFQIIMFLILGLLVHPSAMIGTVIPAVLISVFMILVGRPVSVFACLLPYRRKFTVKGIAYASWVGLRGAVPIMFATYPVVAGIEGSDVIFNVVFFITLFSLVVQGMSLTWMARRLDLAEEVTEEESKFGVELPDDIAAKKKLKDIVLCSDDIPASGLLMDLNKDVIGRESLIILVKRGDEMLTPKGNLELKSGDKLLVIAELNK